MATFRVGVGSFNIKDGAVGIGTESSGFGNLKVEGTVKSDQFDVIESGVSTFTRYSGFSANKVEIKNRNTTLSGENQLIGDLVIDNSTLTVGLGSTASINEMGYVCVKHHFSVPTGDTNFRNEVSGYSEGTIRYNTDLGTMEFFNGDEWRQFTFNSGRSGRAITGGGLAPGNTPHSTVDLLTIPTLGNSVNFGQLHTARSQHGACSSSTRGLFLGGGAPAIDAIEYYTLASAGNGIDFGNLTSTGRRYTSSFSSSTRGFSAGGKDDPAVTNEIDYVEIGTLGDALTFGDLTVAALYWSGLSSPTRGFTLVADDPAAQTINMVTMASTGNAVDFGNQSKTGGYQAAAANSVRGLWAGGYASSPRQDAGLSSSIEAITMASQGTTHYFGDLASASAVYGDGSSTSTRAVFSIGKVASGNNWVNTIEYVTIASSGNAADFGDATSPVSYRGVTSDSHGGLGGY